MSIFPDGLDSDLELPRITNNVSEISGDVINDLRDAVMAIEAAIGINPQGNTANLAARVGVAIDPDGRIRTSALASSGLVTLPISNLHVGTNAAIEESKLDLDYSTATLNTRIGSLTTNLAALIANINSLATGTATHYAGTANRHDGYDIDLTASVLGGTTVESSINLVNNSLNAHTTGTSGTHAASSISVAGTFENITADNAQTAIVELDHAQTTMLETHQDNLHTTGLVVGASGGQNNLYNTAFAGTIYQTDTAEATNILQILRPNVARITSKNIDLQSLSILYARNLRIQAGGLGLGVLDIDLVSAIPATSIDDLVVAINTTARQQHYPIAAYNTGALTLAHNLPGESYTLEIQSTISLDASTALGFSEAVDTTYSWPGNTVAGFIDGKAVTGIKIIAAASCTNVVSSSTISPGLGDLSILGLSGNQGRVLCHITGHSVDPTENGTYYIINYPTNDTFTLNDTIAAGTFDVEVAADSLNFENSARGELFDVFAELDTDGYVGHVAITKYNRVSYGTISGITLKSVSDDIYAAGDFEWGLSDAGYLSIYHNGVSGPTKGISTGFTGPVRVFAPDGVNSAIFQVHGAFSAARKEFTISNFYGDDLKLYLGSIHYGGNFGLSALKYFTDKRLFESVPESDAKNTLNLVKTDDLTNELRSNGVIRGLNITSYSESALVVAGGRAIVGGKILDIPTKTVTVNDVSAASRILLLDSDGNFIIKDTADVGFSFDELTSGTDYGDELGVALVCEFTTDGTQVDGYVTDRRLLVNKIDKRLANVEDNLEAQIATVQSTVHGGYWGFTIAETTISDGYIAGLEMANNVGLKYISYSGETEYSAYGFGAGDSSIINRRFEFIDPTVIKTSVFKSVGLTHINIFLDATYTGITAGVLGPFGVSGTVYVDLGVAVTVGLTNTVVYENYALVKTMNAGVLPVLSQKETYVVSIPLSSLSVSDNVMFDLVPRVRIRNAHYVDGGTGPDPEPTILFDNVRLVTSSYSVAGSIGDLDGTSTAIGVATSDIL